MNDVVIVQIINSLFWVSIFGCTVIVFRKEVKKLLQSLGSFKVAGSSFEFKDKKETIESYVLLSETLIDILSRSERLDALQSVLTPAQIEKLSAFAIRYTEDVPRNNWNEEMLRNVAYLLLRFGRYTQSITIYDALLEKLPNLVDLLNLKALSMITSRLENQVKKALPILSDLIDRYPEYDHIRFNFALAKSLNSEHSEALKLMEEVIRSPFIKNNRNLLEDPLFQKTMEMCKEESNKLSILAEQEFQKRA